jgi:uncharacterized damage-inducible protein DinB
MCPPRSLVPDAEDLPAIPPLIALLRQLASFVESLTDAQYGRKPVGHVPSSIGGHVRHSLDHLTALLDAAGDGQMSYDHRERGTDVERNRGAALEAIRALEYRLRRLGAIDGTAPMRLSLLLSADGHPVEVMTTLERELAFVLSHTIHHNSLLAVMAGLLGVAVPAQFGYAPSTIAHLEGKACAR